MIVIIMMIMIIMMIIMMLMMVMSFSHPFVLWIERFLREDHFPSAAAKLKTKGVEDHCDLLHIHLHLYNSITITIMKMVVMMICIMRIWGNVWPLWTPCWPLWSSWPPPRPWPWLVQNCDVRAVLHSCDVVWIFLQYDDFPPIWWLCLSWWQGCWLRRASF